MLFLLFFFCRSRTAAKCLRSFLHEAKQIIKKTLLCVCREKARRKKREEGRKRRKKQNNNNIGIRRIIRRKGRKRRKKNKKSIPKLHLSATREIISFNAYFIHGVFFNSNDADESARAAVSSDCMRNSLCYELCGFFFTHIRPKMFI